MNQATIIGRLGADPEARNSGSGTAVVKFRVATEVGRGERKRTDWHNVVCFSGLAEVCSQYLRKGSQVAVVGSICNRSYDKQDGTKGYSSEIYADQVEFLSKSEPRDPAAPRIDEQRTEGDMPF